MAKIAKNIKRYSDVAQLETFDERYDYLKLNGVVADETFGPNRYFNQKFYRSKEWKDIRDKVIIRDNGCDLGIPGREIAGRIYIHHMNPIDINDISESTDYLLNPEYLICVSEDTHNAIHYGDKTLAHKNDIIERKPNDTCPWKRW